MRSTISDVLVCAGAAAALVGCLGVLVMRDVYARLHFAGPPVLGAVLVAIAVWVRHGPSLVADKAVLTAVFLLVCGPLVTHATARAARTAERGGWSAGVGDEIEIEDR